MAMTANINVSLDDIIQKKFAKFHRAGRGGMKRIGGNIGGNTGNNVRQNTRGRFNVNRKPGGVQQRRSGGGVPQAGPLIIGDARNKIIQKKRQHLTDARDKLCELAKKSDARLKLEKLRQGREGHGLPALNFGFNGVGGLSRKPPPYGATHGGRGRTGLPSASVTLQRTINQIPNVSRYNPKVPSLMEMDIDMSDDFVGTGESLSLCRTVNNDRMRVEPLVHPAKLSVPSPYSWRAPQRVSVSRGYIDLDYPADERKRMKLPTPPLIRPIQLSDDEDMGQPVRSSARSTRPLGSTLASSSRMSADVKSRLDSSSRNLQSSHSSASGYKIIVSNLQTSVTHEDIRELFEDIGPLLASRLVRPGTAEVVYRLSKDAERAVDNYHNRQLDGQPMKCLLVKPRHPSSSAPIASGSVRPSPGASLKMAGSGKSSVVPDIGTIHKALFNNKS